MVTPPREPTDVSNRQKIKRRTGTYLVDPIERSRQDRRSVGPGSVDGGDVLHDADCPRPDGGPCPCVAELGDPTYPALPKKRREER